MLLTPTRTSATQRTICSCTVRCCYTAKPSTSRIQSRSHIYRCGVQRSPWNRRPLALGWQPAHVNRPVQQRRHIVARATDILLPVGMDVLTFLSTTVILIPIFKYFKVSPILGFLLAGFALQQLGMFQDLEDTEKLAELGVLFLLFEMGLELSLDRLKALAKYAFGMGTLQMVVSTAFFTLFALPVGHGVGTIFLEKLVHAPAGLVGIRSIDEAVVIGAALSLSSSAFVLQLLSDRGELATRFGSATLGILLLQDIAVVPFLVLLPVIENGDNLDASPVSLLQQLAPTALKTSAGLGLLLLGGRFVLRRIFETVAASKSSETFVALCLLTVTGASLLTQKLGLSDTLGAFMAGVLLSETSFRAQVEADIRPFRGLLLGLFFVTTGSSLDWEVLQMYWPVVFWMLLGLIAIKTLIVASIGGFFGLSRPESIRTAFLLSQSGEFAFVLLSLAKDLNVLPENLNHLLIIVVVMSMALTPALADAGKWMAEDVERKFGSGDGGKKYAGIDGSSALMKEDEPVVICGFGPQAQMLANMLEVPLASDRMQLRYVAFDLDPVRVQASRKAGFTVVFGDGSRAAVLKAAGVKMPKAVVVCYAIREQSVRACRSIRSAYPDIPIYAWARDLRHAAELEEAGADTVMIASTQAGLALGSQLLAGLGASEEEVDFLRSAIQEAMQARTHALAQSLQESTQVLPESSTQLEIFVLDTTRHGNASTPPPPSVTGTVVLDSSGTPFVLDANGTALDANGTPLDVPGTVVVDVVAGGKAVDASGSVLEAGVNGSPLDGMPQVVLDSRGSSVSVASASLSDDTGEVVQKVVVERQAGGQK